MAIEILIRTLYIAIFEFLIWNHKINNIDGFRLYASEDIYEKNH